MVSAEIVSGDWYAFRVRPRHEKVASAQLREKGYPEFLPLLCEQRRWGNRTAHVEVPLFPGYIFGRTDRQSMYPILNLPSVIDVVRAGTKPVPAAREEIENLKLAVDNNMPLEPWAYTDAGEPVSITSGPLAGLEGIVVEARQSQRLVLSVSLLRRSVLVEVDQRSIVRAFRQPALLAYGQAVGVSR